MTYASSNHKETLKPILSAPFLAILLVGCLHGPVSSVAAGTPFTVEVWSSTRCPSHGETVTLRATVTNTDSQTRLVELNDRPPLDLSIFYRNPDDTVIRWSDRQTLTHDLTRLELRLGESKTIEMQWVVVSGISIFTASADFIDDPRFVNRPRTADLIISVSPCPGFLGP